MGSEVRGEGLGFRGLGFRVSGDLRREACHERRRDDGRDHVSCPEGTLGGVRSVEVPPDDRHAHPARFARFARVERREHGPQPRHLLYSLLFRVQGLEFRV